ncbi:MAG: NAD(P)-binding protein [Planctomycetia bacterium]|nr:NAD(P)-binding protein [Planctomycetia bacterium]
MNQKIAIIIGAGPAGLTAAYEFLEKTQIKPIIFEMSSDIGGISKTVNYKGNRIDIGGHRFFSKSNRVMDWWQNILPLQGSPSIDDIILDRKVPTSKKKGAPDPETSDRVMLIRNRISRIFFLRSFFDYPISLKLDTFKNLGMVKIIRIGFSYVKAQLFPMKDEKSLEEFLINRFGKELYLLFFKDYTEKVWGVPCNRIKPEWGAQRIKGLSISKAIIHAIKSSFKTDTSITQKKTETSLIEQFTYPKLGPGQLWEEVAKQIKEKGGEIHLENQVVDISISKAKVTRINVKNRVTNIITEYKCDYAFSTMPVQDLIQALVPGASDIVRKVAQGLIYRDFITVGVLLKKMKIVNETKISTVNGIVPDNWIYIQERDVKLGRLQIFNNWSPYMVKDPNTVWIGLEYFCNEGDKLWSKSDPDFMHFAINELVHIDIINKDDVLDSTIIRMPKTYPAYFGSYDDFHIIRNFTDKIGNLFLIGRNGMHRYNNADHSMLTAMTAVDNIINNINTKDNIWDINTEEDYHENDKTKN